MAAWSRIPATAFWRRSQAWSMGAEVQRGMTERNASTPPEQWIAFRFGINLGHLIAEGDILRWCEHRGEVRNAGR